MRARQYVVGCRCCLFYLPAGGAVMTHISQSQLNARDRRTSVHFYKGRRWPLLMGNIVIGRDHGGENTGNLVVPAKHPAPTVVLRGADCHSC